MTRARNERGIALAVAIFALVVVGGLVSAAFFVGVQEQRVGRNTIKLSQAFSAADGGAQAVVNNWVQATYNNLVVGDSVIVGRTAMASGAGWYRGSVRRLNTELYLVRIEGFSSDSTSRQAVGVVVRLKSIQININSALKTRGTVRLGGSSQIAGADQPPSGWAGCPTTRAEQPGIRLTSSDSANIQTSGCSNYDCVAGSPKIQTDNTITSSSLTTFGDLNFDDLRSLANKVLPGGTYSGIAPVAIGSVCSTGVTSNWGAPLAPASACASYFPIIWINGSASITGNNGQGILIVNGDLSVSGGFEFYGPVIVKQTLRTTGTGGHFNGGVIAANTDLGDITVLGDAVINYSSCALSKALNSSANGAQMRERGWINLY
ncbi:MAG: hypothetical protein HY700_03855 [Gemmatimonadetes bacterium]|nr:hypothetical protein [Gemmatimonadota bacterium]